VLRQTRKILPAAALVLTVAACSDGSAADPSGAARNGPGMTGTTATTSTLPPIDMAAAAGATPAAGAPGIATAPGDIAVDPNAGPAGIYAATTTGLAPSVADVPSRVYVPNSDSGTVSVIDPATFAVIDEFHVGRMPHHVIPSHDMQTLYVLDTAGNTITPIDPRTSKPGEPIPVDDPYNLYFTPDGTTAIVVAERYRRLDLYDPHTWQLTGSIPVPPSGVNHADFSPDGRYFYVSCEFSGHLAKVDLVEQRVVADNEIGTEPIDVKLSPDAQVLFVADQARNGVIVADPGDLHEIGFIPTGKGAHGLYFSRDVSRLYASNRKGDSVSVIDVASRAVVDTWDIPGGGSPDMGGVSIDGSQLWLGGRYDGEVYVFDTATGDVIQQIATGAAPHGVALFPQPGRYSLGHTGVYR
jgi:YVTN family beta-propeller protein